MKIKNIAVLGSTGSIGTQTLEVIRNNDDMRVVSLAAGSNITLLQKQIEEFSPKLVCVFDKKKAEELQKNLKNPETEIVTGMDGLIACATIDEADIAVAAVVGMIGIKPVIEAVKAGKDIAFANKETLVTAGHIIMPLAKEYNVKILPVDSEHSAIFQSLKGEKKTQIDKILLTASGGPFRGKDKAFLKHVQLEDALKHPNWSMGHKITIDSASMVNKGLEVMEAIWLFDVELDQIQVVIQPQSIIHSMVQYKDGAVIAQLGTPDMKLPIQYALFYPDREYLAGERLDFWSLSQITFEKPDLANFEGLPLAFAAAKAGGSMPTVFNAANERAVSKFLNRKIGFLDIYEIIKTCMDAHKVIEAPTVEQILQCEQETYEMIESRW